MTSRESAQLDITGSDLAQLDDAGELQGVVALNLSQPTLENLERLAKSATRLERLVLGPGSPPLGLDGLEVLSNGAFELTHLVMPRQNLKGAKAGKLLGGAAFEKLEYLDVGDNPLTDAFFKAFVSRPRPTLHHLGLRSVKMGKKGFAQLAASSSFPVLETLWLEADGARAIGGEAAAIGESGNFRSLLRLNMQGLGLDNDAVAGLLGASGLPRLHELHLGSNGNLDLPALIPRLPERLSMPLRRIDFPGWTNADLPWERLSWMADLTVFKSEGGLVETGAEAFIARAPLTNLTGLDLRFCKLSRAAVALLAKVPFARLRQLVLYHTQLFPDVIGPLLEAPWLSDLEAISVESAEVGEDALSALSTRTTFDGHLRVLPGWTSTRINRFESAPSPAPDEVAPQATEVADRASAQTTPPSASSDDPSTSPDDSAAPSLPSAKEAAPAVLALLRARCEASFGAGKLRKRDLVFDRGEWKMRVAIKPLPRRQISALDPHERVGTLLHVQVVIRITAIERVLSPTMSDKDFARLALDTDATIKPTLHGLVPSPADKHFWRLEDVGGLERMASRIAERLESISPMMHPVSDLAVYAALNDSMLLRTDIVADATDAMRSRASSSAWLSFLPASGLVAALAFSIAGDEERAKQALEVWATNPNNLDASPHLANAAGINLAERYACAQRVGTLVGVDLPAPSP